MAIQRRKWMSIGVQTEVAEHDYRAGYPSLRWLFHDGIRAYEAISIGKMTEPCYLPNGNIIFPAD